MSDELAFTLTKVVADLRRDLGSAARNLGNLQRNATFWLALRAGASAAKSSFALPARGVPDEGRLMNAGYLAAIGFAADSGALDSGSRATIRSALIALMKRSPHTLERSGFADDPLCAAGLLVLAKVLDLEEPANVIREALRDAPTVLSPGVAVAVACSAAGRLGALETNGSAEGLAATILCDRIDQALARSLFPVSSAKSAEAQLLHGLCRGTIRLGLGLDAMLTLAALELDPIPEAATGGVMPQPRGVSMQRTILFLAAKPRTSVQLSLDEEARAIEAKIRASEHRDSIRFRTRWAVRPDDLLQGLNEDRPTIVHFTGHGAGMPGIVLHDESGGDRLVTGRALKRLFSAMKDDVRVVVLSACYSSEQAREIADVIDVVVGMSDSVGERAATVFAAAFYSAIGFGRSVKGAFEQGLAAIDLEGLDDTEVPELLVQSGVDASKLVLV